MWAHGFRYYFTPLRGVLFTFPSRYWFAIGLLGVFSLAGWSRRIRAGFLESRPTQGHHLAPAAASPTGLSPSPGRLSRRLGSRRPRDSVGPTTPQGPQPPRFGLLPFRSPLLGESLLSSPPPATGMFRFAGFAPALERVAGLPPAGLPHSGTPGSMAMCASPGRFAACRALHRLQEPGHPPCALPHFPRARAAGPPGPRGIRARRRAPSGAAPLLHYLYLCRWEGIPAPAIEHSTTMSKNATVENVGVEPTTPCLQSRCSSQLS